MEIDKFVNLLNCIECLKDTKRHSYTSEGRQESVAEHCWRMSVMAIFLEDEFPNADINRVIKMCLLHDVGEIFTGDVPSFEKTIKDEEKERRLLFKWIELLPESYCVELKNLFYDLLENKLCNALDKLETVVQHNEADIKTWNKIEYEQLLTYGNIEAEFSKYLTELREKICKITKCKIVETKIES